MIPHRIRPIALVWLGLGVIALSADVLTAAEVVTESFESFPLNALPAGWTNAVTGVGSARWTVQQDATAPAGRQVLEQSGLTPKPSFPLCLCGEPALRDGFVEVRFKTISGTNDQAAGVVWRAQDAGNYYVCRANALEDNVVLYKVQGGKRTALDIVGRTGGYGVTVPVSRQQWQTLRVDFAGSRATVALDGRVLFSVEDSTFTAAGLVGLWTKADSVTRFDDFRCGPLPVNAAPPATPPRAPR